ncbi:hypothetical protein J4439_02745 [Candidatus Woesearchaeota archaeon]|nr:hypothetical protein [Candidatus Woesearchaeota archaeon]
MIYIHGLRQLNRKSAEIECISLIRELKRKTPYPLEEPRVLDYFSEFLLSETDRKLIRQALEYLPPVVQELERIHAERDPLYEHINVERAVIMLKALPAPLEGNLSYLEQVGLWQEGAVPRIVGLLNSIPRLAGQEQALALQKMDALFKELLRCDALAFNAQGICGEEQTALASALRESFSTGFIFHVSVEETLKRLTFAQVRQRLPPESLSSFDTTIYRVEEICKGVERAYEANMRLVRWALVLYAYTKWLTS